MAWIDRSLSLLLLLSLFLTRSHAPPNSYCPSFQADGLLTHLRTAKSLNVDKYTTHAHTHEGSKGGKGHADSAKGKAQRHVFLCTERHSYVGGDILLIGKPEPDPRFPMQIMSFFYL